MPALPPIDKNRLREAILAKLRAELDLLTRAALMARDEATSEESKAENKYDTHAQEAAYLAGSQAKLVLELRESIGVYQTLPMPDFAAATTAGTPSPQAAVGALIALEARGRTAWYFLGPRNGGIEIPIDNYTVTLVTAQSPLGSQLAGARAGDTVRLPGRGAPQPHRVAAIF